MRRINFHIRLMKYRLKKINYYYVSKCQFDPTKICLGYKMRVKIFGHIIQRSIS